MLKRKGSLASHIVPHFDGRLTEREFEAYQAGMTSIQAELSDLTRMAAELRGIESHPLAESAGGGGLGEIVIGKGDRWQMRRSLIKLSQSEIVLAQRGTEFGIVERFPESSAYARAYGANELTQTGNDLRALLQDYAQNERQALQFLASDLKTKVREVLTEKYPSQNHQQIIRAVSARLNHELNPQVKEAQTKAIKPSKGMRV